jgi:Cu(I)/Ag(I) efflux system membrane fusion protein
MKTITWVGAAVAAALASAVAGYRAGSGGWPLPDAAWKHAASTPATNGASAERVILYWKDPDGKPDFSPSPKKTADGRDYLPVYEDQEADFREAKPAATAAKAGKRILYYRNPMGLPDTSPVPKKDWMGMDYIPVYEGEEDDGSTIKVSLDRVQRSGVRSEPAEMRTIVRPVRAPGTAKPDERTLRTITLRADGFIEALYADQTGLHVKAGEPLFRVYSPQMVSAQVDYRTAVTSAGQGPRSEPGALQRLRNLDVPETVIKDLRSNPSPTMSIDWPSPVTGIVMQKKVVVGQMVKAGEEMFWGWSESGLLRAYASAPTPNGPSRARSRSCCMSSNWRRAQPKCASRSPIQTIRSSTRCSPTSKSMPVPEMLRGSQCPSRRSSTAAIGRSSSSIEAKAASSRARSNLA